MLLEEWLSRHDGAAHTSDIYAAGFSRHAISKGIESGRMLRLRRSWIVLRDCEADIVSAVAAGGRLTCVSEARRLGLWVPDDDVVHISVRSERSHFDKNAFSVHWSRGPAPTRARAPIEPLINVLDHVARCQEPPQALAIWESGLNKRLIAAPVLHAVHWTGNRARRIAAIASSLSDSGMETEFVILMRAIGIHVRQQAWIDGHRVDALIGDRLIIQLDGFAHHSDAVARRRDIEADARLRLRGYTVLRFDYYQVFFQPEFVQETIRTAIAQLLHIAG
ncbi:hypothetical protein RS84_03338 [Microbacterium hydrocarbonoxydans]|uniref:DUF559 domain-containing protein n=1 Tax=Microbacterium hydrocarbonoxydans TaxID=273678 RepID=A0A0M2HP32_9MICO|nr:DUF559 domain-containing protein [Microbacterium hydrocarbonoxydans]KJL46698.1 hypothetical protein RS84_03338 [Microbacterium hydrocarbonoxydans]